MTTFRNIMEGIPTHIIAILIVAATFALIGSMVFLVQHSQQQQIDIVQRFLDSNVINGTEAKTLIQDSFQSLGDKNKELFNILLPVFSAWVGSVVTFYFTKRKQNKDDDDKKSVNTSNNKTNDDNEYENSSTTSNKDDFENNVIREYLNGKLDKAEAEDRLHTLRKFRDISKHDKEFSGNE